MQLIRSGDADDVGFLQDMLLDAAYEPARPTLLEMLATAEIARYVADWGRDGDAALIAIDDEGRRVGAAWYRLFSPDEPGFGFVDPETPEISIGVIPDRRRQGIGTALLEALIEEARDNGFGSLSLSVSPENPAIALYRRCGFSRVPSRDTHWTMRLDVGAAGKSGSAQPG